MIDHMQCEEVIERLLAFLDREVDGEVEQAIERHLKACRACFSRAEFERRLRARIAETGETAAPETLRRRLRLMMNRY